MRAVATTVAMLALLVTACSAGEGGARADGPAPATATSEAASAAPASTPQPTQGSASGTAPRPDEAEQRRLDAQLLAAAWDDDVSRARRLIEAGADPNAKDESVQSPYLVSTSEGSLELLNLMLRHGGDVAATDSFHGTGLIRAADRGLPDVVGQLVQAKTSVDHVNNLGWTALHEAIILGDGSARYVDTVRVLVAAGADVRLPSARDGVTPLAHARAKGYDTVADVLEDALDAKKVSRAAADRALLAAASDGDADAAAVALRAGARLEARDGRSRTPLLLAVTEDRLAVARLLVHLGADPDALDDRHNTPWLVTGVTGSVAMAEVLLPAHPDLTLRNRFGGTSLIPASERGHVDYVRRVLKTGIEVDHVNDLGWTALLEAVILGDGSQRYVDVVTALLKAGADPDLADRNGVTALQHARASGQDRVARVLAKGR